MLAEFIKGKTTPRLCLFGYSSGCEKKHIVTVFGTFITAGDHEPIQTIGMDGLSIISMLIWQCIRIVKTVKLPIQRKSGSDTYDAEELKQKIIARCIMDNLRPISSHEIHDVIED